MTRLEMQERIGTGPYRYEYAEDECDDGATFGDCIIDACGNYVTKPIESPTPVLEYEGYASRLTAICDALNALWEAAQ